MALATRSRRDFLRTAAMISTGFLGLRRFTLAEDASVPPSEISSRVGYGPLLPDPDKILDLPAAFRYRIISRQGDSMDDGLLVPAKHDGMAAFAGPGDITILVRNHECESAPCDAGAFGNKLQLLPRVQRDRIYDLSAAGEPCYGGTTTLIFDTRQQSLERHYLSLAGTLRNCAGGPTPWGSWITCEETEQLTDGQRFQKDHGYPFEVPAHSEMGLVEPVPLRDMGRFRREAIAIDPASGVVYQTEDMDNGLIYRFLPKSPDRLARGGKLQALAIRGLPSLDLRNWDECEVNFSAGTTWDVEWVDLDDVTSPDSDLRFRGFEAGGARFARGEGMWAGRDGIFFACTTGGRARLGQIWRYRPSPREGQPEERRHPSRLELFLEPNNARLIENADNVTISPWGDLVICEDGLVSQHLVGVTPRGEVYRFARNAKDNSEFAGAVFSPDGTTLFVNNQHAGLTFAITGPWRGSKS